MNESLDWARWPAGISHCSKDLSGIGQYPVAKEFLAAFNSNLVQVTINSFPRKECPVRWQRICTEILSLLSFQVLLSLCLFESALWCKMVEYNPDNSTRSRSATGGSCVLPSNSGIGNCSGGQNLGRRQQPAAAAGCLMWQTTTATKSEPLSTLRVQRLLCKYINRIS